MFDSPLAKYIGFILAFLTALFTILAPENEWTWFNADIGWALAGIFGSIGLAQLRAFIQGKQSYKTWVMIVGQLVLSVLLATKNITADIYAQLYALVTSIAGATIMQAKAKENAGETG
jgi:hypothetical protein